MGFSAARDYLAEGDDFDLDPAELARRQERRRRDRAEDEVELRRTLGFSTKTPRPPRYRR